MFLLGQRRKEKLYVIWWDDFYHIDFDVDISMQYKEMRKSMTKLLWTRSIICKTSWKDRRIENSDFINRTCHSITKEYQITLEKIKVYIGIHTYSAGPSNLIFVRVLFVFYSCYIILIEWTFYRFAIYKVYERHCSR